MFHGIERTFSGDGAVSDGTLQKLVGNLSSSDNFSHSEAREENYKEKE